MNRMNRSSRYNAFKIPRWVELVVCNGERGRMDACAASDGFHLPSLHQACMLCTMPLAGRREAVQCLLR